MNKTLKLQINERAFNYQFKTIWQDNSDMEILVGSGGSGKSENYAAKQLFKLLLEKGHRLYGVRKVERSIRKSQWKLLKDQIARWNMEGLFSTHETSMELTCKVNGNTWSALGLDSREKIKSLTEPTGFWVEEATELEEDDLDQLLTRLRGYSEYPKQIGLTFNPIDEYHWLRDRFFPDPVWEKVVKDKFFRTSEKIRIDAETEEEITVLLCHSTYEDNKFLTRKDKARLLMHEKRNPQHFRIYALGQWGRTEGLVYPKGATIIPKSAYPKPEDCEVIYGMDFGSTKGHENGLIRLYIQREVKDGVEFLKAWLEELIYDYTIEGTDLIDRMREFNIHPADPIYYDKQAAEKARMLEQAVDDNGMPLFNMQPADKRVREGIDAVRSTELFSCAENVNFNKEIKMYRLKMDSNGRYIDYDPIKYMDNLVDPVRYAILTHIQEPEVRLAFI